jgi:AraC family transcriptional regulator
MSRNLRDTDELEIRLSELEYRDRINKVIAFIWNNPDGQPTLNCLAAIAGFSPYHFHRIFAAFVGEPLAEYSRRVRLVHACHTLIQSRTPVTEIALSAGYETPAAFTKAFRKLYGESPTHVRSTGRPPVLPINNDSNNLRRQRMNPEIRDLPVMTVYFATARGSINQDFTLAANKAFEVLCSYVEKHRLEHHIHLCLGIFPDDPDIIPADQLRYEAGFVFKTGINPPATADIKIKVIPAGRYAAFLHQGPYSTLWQGWNAIYRDWLPGSGKELRDEAVFEIYLDDKTKTKADKLRTEICVPIK